MNNSANNLFVYFYNGLFIALLFTFGISVCSAETDCKVEVSDFIFDAAPFDANKTKKTTQGYVKLTCSNLSENAVYVNVCLKGPVTSGDSSYPNLSSQKNKTIFTFTNSSSGLTWDGYNSPLSVSMVISPQSVNSQKIPLSVEMDYEYFDFSPGLLSSLFSLPPASLSWHSALTPHDKHCDVISSSETITFNVRASLLSMCEAYTSDIYFGKIFETPLSNVTSRGSIFIKCTSGTVYNVSLRSINGGSDTFIMKNSKGNSLKYTLYKNQERTLLWASGINSKYATGNGKAQQHYVYGLINLPPKYSPPPGDFQDTVIVSIIY